MDAILLEQSCDLTAVECAATICIQLREHIIDDVIGLDLGEGLVVVAMGVLLCAGFEPFFV